MSVKVNDKAPAFSLYASDKSKMSLADFKGDNVVLLFFPLAFSSVCTEELCTMRDSLGEFTDLDARVMAISGDSVFSLEKFKEQEGLTFPLLSDFNQEVSRQYGALYEEFVMGMRGVSKRAAFVVDKEGVIRYAEVLDDAGKQPNYVAIKETLSTL